MARNPEASVQRFLARQRAKYGRRLATLPQKRVAKLGRRKQRIIGFTVDGVLSRITAAQSTGANVERFMAIGRVGGSILAAIRYRQQVLQQETTLRGQRARALVDNRYLRQTGAAPVTDPESPVSVYDSWADYGRAGGLRGMYSSSGGMWAGMESRLHSLSIIHEPTGKSLGATGRTGASQQNYRDRGARQRNRAAGTVSNRDKSYLIWLLHRVNPIEPTKRELDKAAQVLAFDLTAGHIAGWAATQNWTREADRLEAGLWYGER